MNLFAALELWKRQRKLERLFPVQVENVWLAWNGVKEKPDWKNLVPYWDDRWKYINYQVGQVVPFLEKCMHRAYYRIAKIKPASWASDLSGWDDGRHYDFVFDHIEPI